MNEFNIGIDRAEGRKLLTGGKYCERDIYVRPLLEEKTLVPGSVGQVVTPGTGYAGLSQVTLEKVESTQIQVRSAGEEQVILPEREGLYFDSVKVKPVTLQEKSVTPHAVVEIATVEEFQNIPSSGSYKLTADLTLPTDFAAIPLFDGFLDGGGHTIGGIRLPLFQSLSGRVCDLVLEGEIDLTPGVPVGALASQAVGDLSLDAIHNKTNVSSTSYDVGGILGKVCAAKPISVTLRDCRNEGDITGLTYVGGLVGKLENTGGISHLKIAFSENSGSVSMTASFSNQGAGGLVGFAGSNSSLEIEDSANSGEVLSGSGVNSAGGILGGTAVAGTGQKVKILRSVNSGSVTTVGYAGGICGYFSPDGAECEIAYCYNTGAVATENENEKPASGILGYTGAPAKVSLYGCYNIGAISSPGASFAIGCCEEASEDSRFSDNFYLSAADLPGSAATEGDQNMASQSCADKSMLNEKLLALEKSPYGAAAEWNGGYAHLLWQAVERPAFNRQKILPDDGYDGLSSATVSDLILGRLTVTANGTYLPASGEAGIGVVEVNVSRPKLLAPTVTAVEGVKNKFLITNPADNGGFVKEYLVYLNGALRTTTAETTVTILLPPIGTSRITAVARGDFFLDSDPSEQLVITNKL